MCGTAKKRTETSIETMSRGRQRTASAVHSRRPARVEVLTDEDTGTLTICVCRIVFMWHTESYAASAYSASSWLGWTHDRPPPLPPARLGTRARGPPRPQAGSEHR